MAAFALQTAIVPDLNLGIEGGRYNAPAPYVRKT